MMVLAGMACAAENRGVEDFLREQRALREKSLRQRLRRGIAEGDLPASADVNGLVSFYTSILDGMAIRARDGASRKALDDIIKCAMAAWNTVIESHEDL
jgi:hypothetical protein